MADTLAPLTMVGYGESLGNLATYVQGHLGCKVVIDVIQAVDHLLNDIGLFEFVEFKGESLDNMVFFVGTQRVVKQLGLVVVLLELGRAEALFDAHHLLGIPTKS